MQLVAYGAQDIYLTGNPQITFFKVVYRRHTNFSMEAIAQSFNGDATSKNNGTSSASATISRNGDLIHKMYVVQEGGATPSDITDGSSLVFDAELEIGGQKIDKHYQQWNEIWNELSTPESKAIGLKSMQGCIGSAGTTGVKTVQVPLNFWFCRNPGLALPLIALQYHEVKVQLTIGNGGRTAGNELTVKLFVDYIYLDTDERRRFAQVSHEYLIEQIQKQSVTNDTSQKLIFNHPVKELIWTTMGGDSDYGTAQLKLNGHDRFSKQKQEYFQLRQPFDYHTAVPSQNLPSAAASITEYANVLKKVVTGTLAGNIASTQVMVGFTDTAVTQGGTVGGTCAAFDKDTGAGTDGAHASAAANQIFYTFTTDDFETVPVAGDKLLVCYGGVGSDVGDGNATQKFVKVISAKSGSNTAITSAAGFTHSDSTDLVLVLDTILINQAEYDPSSAGTIVWTINSITKVNSGCRTSKFDRKINVYSFALKPEEHQPSGTCNFSRIDTAILEMESFGEGAQMEVAKDHIYAVNYNVLRIMSGMGGLAYSN